MKIGMIGVGKIGSTLAARYAAAGHYVTMSNSRGPDSIRELTERIGVEAVPVDQAVKGADVVIVSIPQMNIPRLGAALFADAPEDLVIVDTGNYMPFRDPPIEAIEAGMVESVWVSQQLSRPVVKAFNSLVAASVAGKNRPAGSPDRIALPVAGDDPRAKRIVMDLVDLAGFDPFDAGTLAESWRQQPGMAAYCTDLTLAELPGALARADRAAGPRIRDAFTEETLRRWDETTPDERIAIIRAHHGMAYSLAAEPRTPNVRGECVTAVR